MLALLLSAAMPEVFASLGSNQNREHHIRSAVAAIQKRYGALKLSPVYQNKAVGFDGDDFLNMVLSFQTTESLQQVQETFHQIEAENGRTRQEERFAPRTLDIDLILYGDLVLEDGNLRLPREDITEYAFVLLPLSEIAPDYRHPVLQSNYQQMWQDYKGSRELKAIEFEFI